MLAAIISLGIAIVLNGGFFTAPGAPAAMVATSVSAGLAAGFFTAAWLYVEEFFICSGSPAECLSDLHNLQAAIVALTTLLTVQAAAALAASFASAVPWLGSAAMVVIAVALAGTIALVIAVEETYGEFLECMGDIEPNFWVITLATIITLGVAAIAYYEKNKTDISGNDDDDNSNEKN